MASSAVWRSGESMATDMTIDYRSEVTHYSRKAKKPKSQDLQLRGREAAEESEKNWVIWVIWQVGN
jgi:hypothetical protein